MTDAREEFRRDGWWRDGTFLDDLRRNVQAYPDKTAVVGHRVAEGRTDTLGYGELARLTDRVAHGLLDLGVKPGEYVGVQLPDRWEMLPLALACIRIGARLSPLMPVYRRREMEFMLRLTEARVFVTVSRIGDLRPADTVTALSQELPTLEHVVVLGGDGPAGSLSFEEHFLGRQDGDPAEFEGRELDPCDPFLILFTSGTTGEPKGALHSQNTLYAGIRGYQGALGLDDGLVKVTPHTNMHYVGFVQGLLAPLALGGTTVFPDVWDPGVHLDLMERYDVTMFYGSPPFVRELLEAQRAKPRDTAGLKYIVSGSAPIPPQMVGQVREAFGVRMYSLWGMTENGPVTMARPDDAEDWPAHSDGRPTGGMQVRIDPFEGRDDGAGPLWVRGPAQCLGYYGRDDLYAEDLDDDGWFNTGDLARDDGRGGIRIAGRTKDIIMYRSFNVPVADVEAVLGKHPKVRDIALIGIPDPAVAERVCAVVTPSAEPPTLGELREYLSDAGVSEWFWPERLELIEAMPRTITGKIRKVDLRQRYGPV